MVCINVRDSENIRFSILVEKARSAILPLVKHCGFCPYHSCLLEDSLETFALSPQRQTSPWSILAGMGYNEPFLRHHLLKRYSAWPCWLVLSALPTGLQTLRARPIKLVRILRTCQVTHHLPSDASLRHLGFFRDSFILDNFLRSSMVVLHCTSPTQLSCLFTLAPVG